MLTWACDAAGQNQMDARATNRVASRSESENLLDLFTSGRVLAKRYGFPSSSHGSKDDAWTEYSSELIANACVNRHLNIGVSKSGKVDTGKIKNSYVYACNIPCLPADGFDALKWLLKEQELRFATLCFLLVNCEAFAS